MRTETILLLIVLVLTPIAAEIIETELMKELDIYTNAKEEVFCWKRSYGRGVGVAPDCGDKEKQAGLCYNRCNDGYIGVGPVCWQDCREGYKNHGASCFKTLVDFYFKNTYLRGIGTIPTNCESGNENKAGRCYPVCEEGFNGVGPLCWKQCTGVTSVDCGAACGSSTKVCMSNIFNMVKNVLEAVKKIAETILSYDDTNKIQTVKGAMKAIFVSAKKFIKENLSMAAFKKFIKAQATKIGESVVDGTIEKLYEEAKNKNELSETIMNALDNLGLVSVVKSFIHEIC